MPLIDFDTFNSINGAPGDDKIAQRLLRGITQRRSRAGPDLYTDQSRIPDQPRVPQRLDSAQLDPIIAHLETQASLDEQSSGLSAAKNILSSPAGIEILASLGIALSRGRTDSFGAQLGTLVRDTVRTSQQTGLAERRLALQERGVDQVDERIGLEGRRVDVIEDAEARSAAFQDLRSALLGGQIESQELDNFFNRALRPGIEDRIKYRDSYEESRSRFEKFKADNPNLFSGVRAAEASARFNALFERAEGADQEINVVDRAIETLRETKQTQAGNISAAIQRYSSLSGTGTNASKRRLERAGQAESVINNLIFQSYSRVDDSSAQSITDVPFEDRARLLNTASIQQRIIQELNSQFADINLSPLGVGDILQAYEDQIDVNFQLDQATLRRASLARQQRFYTSKIEGLDLNELFKDEEE